MEIVKSILYFILAGIFEIGGGYLVWLWLREGKNVWYGIIGAIVLILYGVVPTFQKNLYLLQKSINNSKKLIL